ncbi:exodeoxyribonuclease VII large subunit, partial [Clostridioides difficile]
MKLRALDISEANSYIKRILINDPILSNLKVKGEISNFKVHSSGNVYLSLKDETSKLNCVIFKSNFNRNLKLDNGVKIIANGYISVYERDGAYQLYINEIEIEGIGNLHIEFNRLKEKLNKEGLFDPKYKIPIPKMPNSIGVITSPTGAVIRDIINVIK